MPCPSPEALAHIRARQELADADLNVRRAQNALARAYDARHKADERLRQTRDALAIARTRAAEQVA